MTWGVIDSPPVDAAGAAGGSRRSPEYRGRELPLGHARFYVRPSAAAARSRNDQGSSVRRSSCSRLMAPRSSGQNVRRSAPWDSFMNFSNSALASVGLPMSR